MRLKALDIQGFKSFPDRTKLEFHDGITAVVGPNGSGKSNIADAVRWVLGEQSTRTLRGGKMEDVIFGGTQARKAQGVASVTLLIDNQDHSLGEIEADEVAITRRLYRNGDSEYRINGALVRLRDITELFMDTGLGRDGYSIIGQGKVAEIVSARSAERREIFEEAAGISKFRYRKTDAERRLLQTEENLVRLRDILLELETRLEPLQKQSEKAEQFLVLAAEKKALEISAWVEQLRQLRQKQAVAEDKLLLTQSEFQQADEQVTACEAQFAAEMAEEKKLVLLIEEIRHRITEAQEQEGTLRAEVAVCHNDIAHHRQSIAEAERTGAEMGMAQQQAETVLADAKAHLEEILRSLSEKEAQAAAIVARQGEQENQKTLLEQQASGLRLHRAGIFEMIEAVKLETASSASILTESNQRLQAMAEAKATAEMAVTDAIAERDEAIALLAEIAGKTEELANAARGYQLRLESRRRKAEEANAALAAKEQQMREKEQRAQLLSDMDKNMEGFGSSIKFIMREAQGGRLRGIHGPISTLISVADAHTVAIETALGGAMQNIVVEDEQAGKRAIERLQQAKAGRATFLPLTTVRGNTLELRGISDQEGFVGLASELVQSKPAYRPIVQSLLGRVVVVTALAEAIQMAKQYGHRFRIVTLDGQVLNPGGSMTGGFTVKSAGILGRQGEIDRLRTEISALQAERQTLLEKRQLAGAAVAQSQAELDTVAAAQKSCAEDAIRAEAARNSASQQLMQAEKQRTQVEQEEVLLSARIAELTGKNTDAAGRVQQLEAELAAVQEEIAAAVTALETLTAAQAETAAEQTARHTERLLLERDHETVTAEIARLSGQLGSTAEQQERQAERMQALAAEILAAEEKISTLTATLEGQAERIAAATAEISAAMQQREQSEQRATQLRATEREQGARRDNLYREVVRFTEQKNALDAERDAIVAKLFDEYELTLSAAEAAATDGIELAAANRRLTELRAAIKAIGSVNVDAIDEYREVKERYTELRRQVSDVESAKKELHRIIEELTDEMCRIFSEQFTEINRHFGKIFTQLFEGGTASLSLTDPEHLLESGIEIEVHPPGKLIKNLASLSGGEQSFVAIAIFFAILRVNPSPFCLMDEIEAALDDVNVNRFATYLHTLTEKTQFITITHRRGTMETADVLYGVTMQEEGVSKLLQLKMSEMEEKWGVS